MNITNEWLTENNACIPGKEWFTEQTETNGITVVEKLIAENKLDWANWLIVRLLDRKQKIAYAVFAAEQMLEIFEKQYPDDTRPRQAIEAARLVMTEDSTENRNDAAVAAANAYAYAAAANAYANAAMKIKIIKFGIKLLNKGAK